MTKISLALSAGLIVGANAFWRMECPGRVALANLDPIVNPGTTSPHQHTVHGGSGFSSTAGTKDLLNSKCTSCRVSQDNSAYWVPTLYFYDEATGKKTLVEQDGGILAYYMLNRGLGEKITAFPEGFRMISGDVNRREYTLGDCENPDPPKSSWYGLRQTDQLDLEQRAVGFNCLNYKAAAEPTLYRHCLPAKSFMDGQCSDGLRLEIMFPSCWNGKDLDSTNHKDHVAFPDLVNDGTCPKGYPKRLPSLMYEVKWRTNLFDGKKGYFFLSNGDKTGHSYHGDFMTGWKQDFLQQAIDTCTSLSGMIQDCPLFDVVSEATAVSCDRTDKPIPEAAKDPWSNSPAPVAPPSSPSVVAPPSSPLPVAPPSSPVAPSAPATPVGPVFKESSTAAAASTSIYVAKAAPVPTTSTTLAPPPPPPPAATPTLTESFYTTKWVTNGPVVSKILVVAQTDYVTVTAESVETAAPAPARRHRRGAHLHGRHGKRL